MKTSKLILIAAILFLLTTGGYFASKSLNRKPTTTQTQSSENKYNNEPTKEAEEESSFSGSMKDLFSLGTNLKCTYSFEQEGTTNAGTVYVSGKNLRGESIVNMKDGTSVESSMIWKDNTIYTWGPSMPYGVKIAVQEDMLEPSEDTERKEIPENIASMQQNLDYKCFPWIPDMSKFDLPTDVEFKDMSSLTQPTDGNGQNLCDLCALIADDGEKANCLKSFNCE